MSHEKSTIEAIERNDRGRLDEWEGGGGGGLRDKTRLTQKCAAQFRENALLAVQ